MAEWSIAAVLKTAEPKGSVGSNPTPSAIFALAKIIQNHGFELQFDRRRASGIPFTAKQHPAELPPPWAEDNLPLPPPFLRQQK